MKLYTQNELGIKTPKDGFIDGGWYKGRNYYRGTFSESGVIHPMLKDSVSLITRIKFYLFCIEKII